MVVGYETNLDTKAHEELWRRNHEALERYGIQEEDLSMLKIFQPGYNYVITQDGELTIGKQGAGGDYFPLPDIEPVPYHELLRRFEQEKKEGQTLVDFVEKEYERIANEVKV